MPRLRERSDGCYYVVGFHHESYSTWQIDGEGVRFLWARNIFADDRFSTDMCFELLRRGLIYTEGTKEMMKSRHELWKTSRKKQDGGSDRWPYPKSVREELRKEYSHVTT